jgi:uncharacterized membrane protein YhaH (DUF805 family)
MAFLFSFISLAYLRPHLKNILVDLCGTKARADFWMAFSSIALTVTPVIFATLVIPHYHDSSATIFFDIIVQLRWGLIGLIGTVLTLGYTLNRFIDHKDSPKKHEA